MNRSTLLFAAVTAIGCNKSEFTFPDPIAVQFAETPPNFGSWLDFDVAPDGHRITMSYYDRTTTGIGFATGTLATDGTVAWRHERVDGYPESDGLDRGDRGKYGSHVVGADGTVWAAYQDAGTGTLKVSRRLGPNQWESSVVDAGIGIATSGAGYWTSIALMENGFPIVAHHDKVGGVLRVSSFDGTTWVNETAADGEDVGRYANLEVVGSTVYIAFYNGGSGNLELLEGGPGNWARSEVDVLGDVGQWPSIWADEDELIIAYHHVGDQDLKLARRVGGSWATGVIDSGAFRGADSHLFVHGGLPHVAYFDGMNNDLLLASQDEQGVWSTQTLAGSDGAVGFFNEVVEVNGRVIAGTYDHTASRMRTLELFTGR